jgi:hypothetical protein
MGMKLCPRCGQRVIYNDKDVDVQHNCNSGDATSDYEDVIKGTAQEGGSGNYVNLNWLGFGSNKLKYKDSGLEGEESYDKTVHGNRESTHEQRRYVQHIKLK